MLCLALECVGGQGDDRDASLVSLADLVDADGRGQLIAVHFRHVQVGEQQRVVTALPAFQRFAAVAGDICRISEQRELLPDHFLVDFVVFGHQDQPALLQSHRARGGSDRRLEFAGERRFFFLMRPSCGDGHCPEKGLGMHDIAVQGDKIHRFDAPPTTVPAPDDDKAGLDIGLMVPVLDHHEMQIQVRSGAAGSAQFLDRWRIVPGVDDE